MASSEAMATPDKIMPPAAKVPAITDFLNPALPPQYPFDAGPI